MATRFTSTINVRCVKEHICVACGGSYSYDFVRNVSGSGSTPDRAQKAAAGKAERTVATEVDPQPCPSCGLLQPDMVAQRHARSPGFILAVSLLMLPVLILPGLAEFVSLVVLVWIGVACGALAAGVLLHAVLRNPNRDVESNHRVAAERVASGSVRVTSAGRTRTPGREWTHPQRPLAHGIGLILLPVAILTMASPEILRLSKHWGLNDTWPAVVGPGDVPTVYMDRTVQCLAGKWCGWPKVTIQQTDSPVPPIDVPSTSKDITFGQYLDTDGSSHSSTSTPWVSPQIPHDPNLAGKNLHLDIQMRVQYAVTTAGSVYDVQDTSMSKSITLSLGAPGAGRQYTRWWWAATVLACLLLAASCISMLVSARQSARRALPPAVRLVPLPAAAPPPPPPAPMPRVAASAPPGMSQPPAGSGSVQAPAAARSRGGKRAGILVAIAVALAVILPFAYYFYKMRSPGPADQSQRPFSTTSNRIVFLVNSRGYMLNAMADAANEMKTALDSLKPDQSFDIVTCGDKVDLFNTALQPATPANIKAARAYIERIQTTGTGNLLGGMRSAIELGPDVIWLVDNGQNPFEVPAEIKHLNSIAKVRINSVTEFADSSRHGSPDYGDIHQLWEIAHNNGGVCIGNKGKPIDEPKCAQLPMTDQPPGQSIFHE